MRRRFLSLCLALTCLALQACVAKKATPEFHGADNPAVLSEWGVLSVKGGKLELGQDVVPYSLNSALFTDYAHKLRTIWMPQGKAAQYREGDGLDFPIGTIISKTFYYPSDGAGTVRKQPDRQSVTETRGLDLIDHKLIETRLLVRREAGWEPLSYIWNKDQTEAKLTRIGALIRLVLEDGGPPTDFVYSVPNINQCAGCHAPNNTTKTITLIGPKPRHLNRIYTYAGGPMNQLDKLAESGYLNGVPIAPARTANWENLSESLNERARAYLDINCAHCHNPVGPADTSGLHLNPENESLPHLGICKNAVAAGGGTGGRKYDITPGNPDDSIFVYRMLTRDPGNMMPELGRSLTHSEGVDLIAEWIAEMEPGCN